MENEQKQMKKTPWQPNGCSFLRWVIVGVLAMVGTTLLSGVTDGLCRTLLHIPADSAFAYLPNYLGTMLGFAAGFWWTVFLIRRIAKTSFRDFLLGSAGRLDIRQCVTISLLFLVGFLCLEAVSVAQGNVILNPAGATPILVNFALCLLLVWMQTTFEEIVFRGLFLRAACGDKIRPSVFCIVMGVVSSLLFMAMHLGNVEVTQQNGVQVVLSALVYFVMAALVYAMDVVFGSLMPGIMFHWTNNFLIFAFVTAEGSTVSTPALFLEISSGTGASMLVSELIVNLPVMIFLILTIAKKRRQVQEE